MNDWCLVYVISSVRYYIISVEMAVLAATLTAQLFGPALTSSFHALCFIFSSAWTSSSAVIFWHLFVVLEWCKTAAHSRCWIRLSLGLNPSPQACFTLHTWAAKQRYSATAGRFMLYFHTDSISTAVGLCTEQSYFWLAMFTISLYNRHA